MSVRHRLAPGRVRRRDQLTPRLGPRLRVTACCQNLARLRQDRAPPQLVRDLLEVSDRPTGIREGRGVDGGAHREPDFAASATCSKIAGVTLEQGSWLTVVIVCGIAVVLLAVGGYTGYSIVVGAVGLAAAVNLL